MMQKKTLNTSIRCLLYFFGMLLVWEWVRPVGQLTNTGNLSVFLVFAIFSLLLHYLQLNWLGRFAFLSGYTILSLQYLYYDVSLFNVIWIWDMIEEFKNNLRSIFAGEWLNLSNPFRSLLFFILIWLVTYLIHYWITVKKKIFLFFLSTVTYLSFLDTFTIYDADQAIIRTIIIGFIFLGLLAFFRLLDREGLEISAVNLGNWVLPLGLMLVLSTLFAFAAPKLDPQWPDPVPFFKTQSGKEGSGGNGKNGINQMGYSENDNRLGGSIEGNDTVIFYHNAKDNPYWKVENKDIYTGKGWKDTAYFEMSEFTDNQDISAQMLPKDTSNIKLDEYSVDITVKKTYNHVVLPEPSYLKKIDTKDESSFRFDELTEKLHSWSADGVDKVKLNQYTLDYLVPSYDLDSLKKVTDEQLYEEVPMWSEYTQLPEIPERVRELAYEITAEKTNWYDKVKAIENYFDRPEFVYDKTDIPYPEGSQDYVDQFLFETQRGYCDNFSSAMIVLLRVNGIPSRWAKGYTTGVTSTYKGNQVKKVTNNNAHSWVEVYFPGTGWISFEPTKGFSNSASFYDSSVDSTSTSQNDMPDQNADELKKPDAAESKTPAKNLDEPASSGSSSTDSNWSWITFTIVGIGLGLIGFYVYKSRRKWLPWIYIRRYKQMKNHAVFSKAYLTLLTQLQRAGIKRPEGQTLREYAVSVDSRYGVNEAHMQKLTKEYERIIYRGDTEKESLKKNFELWEKLIKKTTT